MTENENQTPETSEDAKTLVPGEILDGLVIEHETQPAIRVGGMIGHLSGEETYPKPGTSARVFVETLSADKLGLSLRKAELLDTWDWIQTQIQEENAVDAIVLSETRGGYALGIRNLKAILSDRDLMPGRSARPQIGESLNVRIIQYRDRKNQLIVSERALVEGSLEERRTELLEELEVGQVLTAEVRRFANFGAFVDLGGLDALLHVKDISWKRIQHPSEALRLGDVLTVQVLEFERETEKVSVGLKQMTPDPWLTAHENYPPQKKISGRVVGLTKFGAFVMLADGIEGLVHVSEMSWTEKIQSPKEKVKVGDLAECWVVRCETDRRRLGLTMKDPENNPWLSIREKLPIGTEGDFKIARVVDFGLFVELDGGLDGLIHVSDFSWAIFEGDPKDMFTAGETVRAIMLDIDEERGRANLGIKQLNADLMTELMKRYDVDQTVSLTITSIQSDGFFGSIEDGLEGFVPSDGIPEIHRSALDQHYEPEQVVEAKITIHDLENKRIELQIVNESSSGDSLETEIGAESDVKPQEIQATPGSADEQVTVAGAENTEKGVIDDAAEVKAENIEPLESLGSEHDVDTASDSSDD